MKNVMNMVAILAITLGACMSPRQSAPDDVPHVVFVSGDHEYHSEETFPILASAMEERYGIRATVITAFPDQNAEENIPGLEILETADLAVFYLRWRRLPEEQLRHIDAYVRSGRPVAGFRTTTHAFNFPQEHPLASWNRTFGEEVFGSPPGWGGNHTHYGHQSSTDVTVIPGAEAHPVLKGVDPAFHVRSWLYHVLPDHPPADATPLLMGRAVNPQREQHVPNPVAWTWENRYGGRVFFTTMGHPEDFRVPSFERLAVNGILWAAGLTVPDDWAGPIGIEVEYEGIRR